MKQTVYIETTIVSYLAAQPSRDLIVAAHQKVTRDWWDEQRGKYRLLASPVVLAECAAGDPAQSELRQKALSGLEILEFSPQIDALASRVAEALNIPDTKRLDAVHLAYAVDYQVDFVLTWNCAHLANAHSEKALAKFCKQEDLWMPIICTPEEMMPAGEE